MSAVADAVSSVVNTVVDTVSSVGTQAVQAVENAGQTVVDNVVQPVVKAVQNTYDAFEKDPLGTSIKIAAAVSGNPAYIMAANTAVNIAQGQDVGEALENGAKATAITFAAQQAGQYAANEFAAPLSEPVVDMELGPTPTVQSTLPPQPAPASPLATTAVKTATEGATRAALAGKDPIEGAKQNLAAGLVSTGTSAGAKEISDTNLENWSQEQAQNAYENAPSPTEQDVLAADTSVPLPAPLATPTQDTGAGYYDETTGEFVPSETGVVQAPLTDTSGTNLDSVKENADLTGLSNTQTPLDTAAVLPAPTELSPEAYDPLKQSTIKSGLDYAANALLNQPKAGATPTTPTTGTTTPASLSQQVFKDPILSSDPQYLGYNIGNQNTQESSVNPYELKQLYDSLDPRLAEELKVRGIEPPQVIASNTPVDQAMYTTKLMATGGSTNPYFTDLPIKNVTPNMLPAAPVVQTPSRLGALKYLYSGIGSKQPHLAAGGLPSKYTEAAPKGHNPEFITGLTGYYAQGKGTGQSDDIPAMLHDGDYVADADLVAALGDGSSKAGAEALEKFRRQIPHQHAVGGQPVAAKIADGEYVFPAEFCYCSRTW